MGLFKKKRRNLLEIKKLRFGYEERPVLRGVDLSIEAGRILALVGPSGSGKSTLLKIMAGELRKAGGKIIRRRKGLISHAKIAYVPQEIALLPNLTLEENIIIFGNIFGVSSRKAIMKGRELASSLEMEDKLNRKINTFSGGQKVRANIICSLLHDPDIVLLDEPFTGLDFRNRMLLWKFSMELKRARKAVVLTTHNLEEAGKFCDEIAILKDGRIIARGNEERIRRVLKAKVWVEMEIKNVSNMSKLIPRIKEMCEENEIFLVEYPTLKRLAFIMENEEKISLIEALLRKEGVEFKVIERKTPTLDETFLKVSAA